MVAPGEQVSGIGHFLDRINIIVARRLSYNVLAEWLAHGQVY